MIGAIQTLAILAGAADLPVVAALGIVVIAVSRSLARPASDAASRIAAGLVVVASASLGLLRWQTTSLVDLRGLQAVLGPTVLVGPERAATGAWVALVTGACALALILGRPHDRIDGAAWAIALAAGALLLATAFYGPQVAGWGTDSIVWNDAVPIALATGAIAVGAGALGVVLSGTGGTFRWSALGGMAVLLGVAAVLISAAL